MSLEILPIAANHFRDISFDATLRGFLILPDSIIVQGSCKFDVLVLLLYGLQEREEDRGGKLESKIRQKFY